MASNRRPLLHILLCLVDLRSSVAVYTSTSYSNFGLQKRLCSNPTGRDLEWNVGGDIKTDYELASVFPMIALGSRFNHTYGFYLLLLVVLVLIFRDLRNQRLQDSPGIENEPVELVQQRPLTGRNLRIMAIGDSVTAGALGTNSYRADLIQLLHHNTVEMVGNVYWGTMKPDHLNRCEAHMAQALDDIAPKLPASLDKFRPNVVLLHLGTNDVAWKLNVGTIPNRMELVIDTILGLCPDAVLLVALIIPCAFRIAEVKSFNRALLDIVMKRVDAGKQLIPVDMYSAFEFPGHPNFLADISHPNAEGYWVMAQEWHDALQRANGLGWVKEPVNVTNI